MKYYGQYKNPSVDEYIHNNFFPDKRGGFFIECGAYDGITHSTCKFFEESMDWNGVNIEADPVNYKLLMNNRPNSINLRYALVADDSKNTVDFTTVTSKSSGQRTGLGSINIDGMLVKQRDKNNFQLGSIGVVPITYHNLAIKHKIRYVDLFVLDVEGYELEVIKGMEGGPWPYIICVEDSIAGKQNLKNALEPKGYEFFASSHINSFFVKK